MVAAIQVRPDFAKVSSKPAIFTTTLQTVNPSYTADAMEMTTDSLQKKHAEMSVL